MSSVYEFIFNTEETGKFKVVDDVFRLLKGNTGEYFVDIVKLAAVESGLKVGRERIKDLAGHLGVGVVGGGGRDGNGDFGVGINRVELDLFYGGRSVTFQENFRSTDLDTGVGLVYIVVEEFMCSVVGRSDTGKE